MLSMPKQNKRHDGSYMCRLCLKTKPKNAADRTGAVYAKNKTRDMMDCIGVVYGRRKKMKGRDGSYGCCICQK